MRGRCPRWAWSTASPARCSARRSRSASCGSPARWRCRARRRAACATTSSARRSCAPSTARCRRRGRSSTRSRASTRSRRSTGRRSTFRAPRAAIARDPDVRAAAQGVVKVQGTACGLGVEGSGWIARPGVVVTNAHVVAGQSDTTVQLAGTGPMLAAHALVFDPERRRGDPARRRPRRPRAADRRPIRGRAVGAILGLPRERAVRRARGRAWARRARSSRRTPTAAGRSQRSITTLRGIVRPGNSGGPVVDAQRARGHDGVRGRAERPGRAATACPTAWSRATSRARAAGRCRPGPAPAERCTGGRVGTRFAAT